MPPVGGRYVLEKPIGQGGMAHVYQALDLSNGKRVAFKLLRSRAQDESLERSRERFQREFHTLVQLAHPRIVAALDYGESGSEHGGQPYYTMELLDGGDLRARSPLPWQQACAVAHDLCSALSLVHSRRLVYRDLSPRNVLCASDGTAKLIDFGAMAPMGSAQSVVCTPTVASPELVYRQAVDGRSDLYALGATLYCMLVGRMPYPVREFQQLPEQWQRSPPRPSQLVPEVPAALDALVMELLQLDAQLRPSNATEVGQRLSAIAGLPEAEQLPFSQAYLTTPELIGREHELTAFQTQLARLQSTLRGAALLLRGARGVGRSRVLDACVLAGKLAGLGVVQVGCGALARGPYAVAQAIASQLIDALPNEALRAIEPHAALLCALLPALRDKLPEHAHGSPAAGEVERGGQAALRAFVLQVARYKPLLLAIDDVEHGDAQSVALLALLAHEAAAQPLLLAVTSAAEPRDESDALRTLASACTTLTLPLLDAAQTRALLASMFGDVPNIELLVRRLYALAGGNPQDLLRLLQHLLGRGVLVYRAGAWVLPDRFAVADLPGSMAQAFAATVDALDFDARALGRAFAACPEEAFTLEECATLSADGDAARAFAAIDELFGAGVIVARGAQYALAAQVWVAPLAGGQRDQSLHARLARVFERRGDGLRAARHLFAAGRDVEGVETLLAYSEESSRRTDASSELFVELLATIPRDWLQTFDTAYALCEQLGRSQHDLFVLERRMCSVISQQDRCSEGHQAALAQRLARYAGLDLYAALDPQLPAAERLQRALAGAAERYRNTPERDRVLDPKEAIGQLARTLVYAFGSFSRSLDFEEWSRMPSLGPLTTLSPAVAVVELFACGFDARLAGRLEQAAAIYGDTLRLVEETSGGGLGAAFVDSLTAGVAVISGTLDAVLGRPAAEAAAATVERYPLYQSGAVAIRQLYKLWQGDVVGADQLGHARELWRLEQTREQASDAQNVLWLLPAHAASDDLTRTRHCLEAIERTAGRMPTWQPIASWARAEYERVRGDQDAARGAADAALARLPPGKHSIWPMAVATRLRVLCAQGRFVQARQDGERDLRRAESAALGFLTCYIRMPLAIACAQLGDAAAAWQHVRTVIATFEVLGASGLNLGLAYECAAQVAACCADAEASERYTRLCKRCFLEHPNPALAAKYQRLVRLASRPQCVEGQPGAREAQSSELARAQVESLLTSSDRSERLTRALSLLIGTSGAQSGALYACGDDPLRPSAYSEGGSLPPEVAELAARQLELAFSGGADDATVDAGDSTFSGQWTSLSGQRFLPLLLSHHDGDRLVITGLVVLRCEQAALATEVALIAAELSRSLADRGDL